MAAILDNYAGHAQHEVLVLLSVCQASTRSKMRTLVGRLRAQPALRALAQRLLGHLQRQQLAAQADKALLTLLRMATGTIKIPENNQTFCRVLAAAATAARAASASDAAAEVAGVSSVQAAQLAHRQQQQQQQQQLAQQLLPQAAAAAAHDGRVQRLAVGQHAAAHYAAQRAQAQAAARRQDAAQLLATLREPWATAQQEEATGLQEVPVALPDDVLAACASAAAAVAAAGGGGGGAAHALDALTGADDELAAFEGDDFAAFLDEVMVALDDAGSHADACGDDAFEQQEAVDAVDALAKRGRDDNDAVATAADSPNPAPRGKPRHAAPAADGAEAAAALVARMAIAAAYTSEEDLDAEEDSSSPVAAAAAALEAALAAAVAAGASSEEDGDAAMPPPAVEERRAASDSDSDDGASVAGTPPGTPGTPPRADGAWGERRAAQVGALAALGHHEARAAAGRRAAPDPQALEHLRGELRAVEVPAAAGEAAIAALLRGGLLVDTHSVLDTVDAMAKTRLLEVVAGAAAWRAAAVGRQATAEQAVVDAEGYHGAARAALAAARARGGGGGVAAAFVEDAARDVRTSAAAAQAARKARDRAELHLTYVARSADSTVAALGVHAATRRGDPLAMWLGPVLTAARAANPQGDAFPGSDGYSGELTAGSYLDLLALLCRYGGLTHEGNLCDAGSGRGMMLLAAAAVVGCATCGFEIDALRARICVRCIGAGWTKLAALVGPGGGLAAATAFMVSLVDLAACATLGGGRAGATHVFAFDTAMPWAAVVGTADAANATPETRIVVSFRNMVAAGLRAVEVPRLATSVAMHGSSERKTARFFRMTPGRRGTAPRGAPHGDGGSFSLDGEGGLLTPVTGDHLDPEGWLRRRPRRT